MAAPQNLAKRLHPAAWAQHVAAQTAVKAAMPDHLNRTLLAFSRDARTSLGHTTFRYIADFLETGRESERLEVGCADFGFALGELRGLREAGVSAQAVALGVARRAEGRDPEAPPQ